MKNDYHMKEDNKKILHVRHTMGEGGITTFVEALVELNQSLNTKHDILIWKETPKSKSRFDVIDISKTDNKKNEFKKVINEYDKIFVHSLMPFMIWSLISRKSDVFLFQHGITFGAGLRRIVKRIYYFLIINVIGFKIICSSNFAKKKLLNKIFVFNKNQIKIVGFGIKLDQKVNPVVISDSLLRIGFAGRLVAQKRVFKIFEALEYLKNSIQIEFHVAGDGPLLNDLKSKSKEFENTNITFVFHGFVSNMDDFYSRLNVFILPSLKESFGLVVLEALTKNVPVIVFEDGGACVEFIKGGANGYVVKDVKELSHKIESLKDLKIRTKLKSNISNMSFYEYDIENTRVKLDEL